MSRRLGGGVCNMIKQILVPLGDPSHYVTPNPSYKRTSGQSGVQSFATLSPSRAGCNARQKLTPTEIQSHDENCTFPGRIGPADGKPDSPRTPTEIVSHDQNFIFPTPQKGLRSELELRQTVAHTNAC
jgi:hypothetical protein